MYFLRVLISEHLDFYFALCLANLSAFNAHVLVTCKVVAFWECIHIEKNIYQKFSLSATL